MKELKSHFHLQRFLKEDTRPAVILYYGSNHPPSELMLMALTALRQRYDGQARFGFADVGRLVSGRRALKIDAIPVVWIVENMRIVDILQGADARTLSMRVASLVNGTLEKVEGDHQYNLEDMLTQGNALARQRASDLIKEELLVLVGPGSTVEEDSRRFKEEYGLNHISAVVTIGTGLREVDEELGEAFCEEFGGWHEESYIFIEGEKVTRESLLENLDHYLPRMQEANRKMVEHLNQRLVILMNKSPVMLFMKGTKERPFCKFSKEMVRLLNDAGVEFDYFDIFSDDKVREGLKKFSHWPTYPQLYVKGELVGGVDIIKQMIQEANGVAGLKDALLQVSV